MRDNSMRSSGWMFTDANNWVGCSKCGQPAGERCRTLKGRFAQYPHGERCQALYKHPDYDLKNYQGTAKGFTDWVSFPNL